MENSIYLITGEDLFEREKELNKIKQNFGELVKGINFVTLDKETLHLLSREVTTYPFGFTQKLIIVNVPSKSANSEENTSSKNDWFNEELMDDILNAIDYNVIIFIGDIQSRSKLYKFVSKNGKCIECNKPKSKKDLAPWIVSLARQNGKIISLENANYMLQICGTDKLMLSNEIQKIVDYIGENSEIQKKDIEKVGIRTLETIIFDLTDAVGNRNIAISLKYLDELLMQKEPLQKILIMIARHFKSLLITKMCIQNNVSVSEELNIKFPFIVNKYKEQSKRFKEEELKSILIDLADLDSDSKIGKIDLKIGLELCLIKTM
ncbi:MAG: DNA polymerase III subunit delta [Clostridia bacterium]|nr:DNA polymerase III subunit delta [Clostridia bacterium]